MASEKQVTVEEAARVRPGLLEAMIEIRKIAERVDEILDELASSLGIWPDEEEQT